MNQPKLLVVGGYATSGKDALANFLVSELGWYKTYMSKPLENALLALNPWIQPRLDGTLDYWSQYRQFHERVGYDETKKHPEVRRLLQSLGTEIGRQMFDENAWLDLVSAEVHEHLYVHENVVVTGVRYPNELDRFKYMGAESLWIHRPGVTAVNSHSSDNTLSETNFDAYCYNAGTLDELRLWTVDRFQ